MSNEIVTHKKCKNAHPRVLRDAGKLPKHSASASAKSRDVFGTRDLLVPTMLKPALAINTICSHKEWRRQEVCNHINLHGPI